jgi:NADH:ubiquinone oxidoreductase subunit D
MERLERDDLDSKNPSETRSDKYTDANDRLTEMTDMERCIHRLEQKGYTDQFRVEKKKLVSVKDKSKKYKPDDVVAANFFRFEGISDPDDTSVLYAIETTDGEKGTLVDAYGLYADDETGEFMKEVEVHKKVTQGRWE